MDGLRTLDKNRGRLVNQLGSKIGAAGSENKSISPRFCLFSFYSVPIIGSSNYS